MPNILLGEGRTDMTQTEFRSQSLEGIIREGISKITVISCANCIAHVQRFISNALNMIDVQF